MYYAIFKIHQLFADYLNNQRVVEHPEEFLGPNWKNVLNFWRYLDTLSDAQWNSIKDAYLSLSLNERQLAYAAAELAAWAAGYASHAMAIVLRPAGDVDACVAALVATYELIGSHILKERNKSLVMLPLFLNV